MRYFSLLLCTMLSFSVACASTPDPKPEHQASVAAPRVYGMNGGEAQRLVNELAPALPQSTSFIGLLDLKGLRAYTTAQNMGGARKGEGGLTFWNDWSALTMAKYGLAPTDANAVGLINFGSSSMFYINGAYDAASLNLESRMIRGRSFSVLKTERGVWLMTNAPSGYFVFTRPSDAQDWVGRKQATVKQLTSWARMSSHPSSFVHVAASSSWKPYVNVVDKRAGTLNADSMHGWVEDKGLTVRIEDDNEGTLAAWRVVMETILAGAHGRIDQQRQRSRRRKTSKMKEVAPFLAVAHWGDRLFDQLTIKQSKTHVDITMPNPITDPSFTVMALAGLVMESMERSNKSQARRGNEFFVTTLFKMKAEQYWREKGQATCALPKATLLTPAKGEVCACRDRINGCPTPSPLWKQEGWQTLGFKSDSEDTRHYALERDGDRLWMVVREDSDCDGVHATWRMSMRVVTLKDGTCSLDLSDVYSRNLDERP